MNKQGQTALVIAVIALLILIGGFVVYSRSQVSDPVIQRDPPLAGTSTDPVNEPTQSNGMVSKVKVFFISLNDNGASGKKIGCEDSVVGITRDITPTQAPLRSAYEALLAEKNRVVGQSGLTNILAGSKLKLDSATVANGKATVKLSGTFSLGGVCDDPRFKAQLEETALQFPTVKSVDVFINNKTLTELLSQKG